MLRTSFARALNWCSLLIAGATAAIVALVIYWLLFGWPMNFWASLAPMAALGVALTSMLFWWFIMIRTSSLASTYVVAITNGSLTGIISSLAAYPVIGVLSFIQLTFTGHHVNFPGDLFANLFFSLIVLPISGGFTMIVGTIVGGLLAGGLKCAARLLGWCLHSEGSPCFGKCLFLRVSNAM